MIQLFYKIIYNPIINYYLRNINKALNYVYPIFKLPPSGRIVIELHNNKKLLFYTNQTDHVSFLVFWNGVYNYEYIDIFEDVIKKCSGLIDIGSNGGLYSILGSLVNNNLKVISFDPTEAASHHIKKI